MDDSLITPLNQSMWFLWGCIFFQIAFYFGDIKIGMEASELDMAED